MAICKTLIPLDHDEDTVMKQRAGLPRYADRYTLRERALLHALAGWNQGEIFPLGDGVILIGRGQDAGVYLRDRSVSRHHARIENTGSGMWIEDLGSSNGTFVNGVAVRRVQLRDGDRIRIGFTTVLRLSHYYDVDPIQPLRAQEA